MNELKRQAMIALQMLWRQKWLGVGIAWLVCTVGWIGVAFIPTRYESSARVYLNADPLLTPLLHGLAADTDPTRHLEFLQRTLLSRPNLEQLVRLTDLDEGLTIPEQKENLYKRLASEIGIQAVTPAGNLMTISYRNKDPATAKNVVQSLLTIFAERTAGSSRSEMDSAQRFLDDEIAAYRDQLRAEEKRRAELARQYPDLISSSAQDDRNPGNDSRTRLDRARGAVESAKNDLDDAKTKRDAIKQQLSTVPQMLSVERAPQVVVAGARPVLSPDEERLQQLRATLDQLRLKYTDAHPDVIATRAEIQQLEGQVKHNAAAAARATPNQDKSQLPNTVYDQLKVRSADAEAQVAAAQRRLTVAQSEEQRIQKIAQSVPTVMTEAEDLDRDYLVLRKNYQELVTRRQATQIADAADTKTEKIQFRITDPPQLPLVPAEPNRPLLISLVLVAGVGAGMAAPIFLGQLDRSFATLSQLRDLGVPVLGSVTRLALGKARRQATIQFAGVCASTVVLIAVYGTLLVLSVGHHFVGVS
jgi:polysaccharide chain length determinant protein (PEP-CTERM system associated)